MTLLFGILGTDASQSLAATSPVIVVSSAGDADDSNADDDVCRTSDGTCTLRAAITEANARRGPDRIEFDISGSEPHSIEIVEPLPTLDDRSGGTTIDGYTQPGSRENASATLSNASIAIQIVGPRSLTDRKSTNGLQISSGDNVVRGLAFLRLKRSIWIVGRSAINNVVAGCFVGLGADGVSWYDEIDAVEHRGGDSGAFGILISTGASDNVIGGSTLTDRNVVSGSANDGISMRSRDTHGNVVANNLVGLSPDGASRVRNWGDGIDLNYGATNNRVGGLGVNERNVVSGNAGEGVEISHGEDTAFNVVEGNYIGTDVSGDAGDPREHGNAGFGLSLEGDVTRNVIGPNNVISNNALGGIEVYGDNNVGNQIFGNRIGVSRDDETLPNRGAGVRVRSGAANQYIGPDNVIAHNSGAGVLLSGDDVDHVLISRNVIRDNGGLAIDIDPLGVNGSDAYRHDGPNQRLNAPILARARGVAVSGVACPSCTVEVYQSRSSSTSAAEARALLGVGVADDEGIFVVAVENDLEGAAVAALAIDPDGNTSELSTVVTAPVGRGEPQVNTIPGRVEAENYRPGVNGDSFSDSSPGNQGGAYRSDDVDIKACGTGTKAFGCYVIGFLRDGEWLEYDIWVESTSDYTVTADVAGPFSGRALGLSVDGTPAGTLDVPDSGSFHRWDTASGVVSLTEGRHTLRVEITGGGFLLEGFAFEPT